MDTLRAVSYVRVSTQEQVQSGAGLSAQRHTITEALRARGWTAAYDLSDEGVSGGVAWQDRPGLSEAISLLESGVADVLIVAKLDRLSRSIADFANLVARAKKKKWAMVILDVGLDLSTPTGELMGNILAAFSQFERALISQRTKEGLARKKADGVKLGRRSTVPDDIRRYIIRQRDQFNWPFDTIAALLNRDRIPTPQGGTSWRDTSVRAVYRAAKRDSELPPREWCPICHIPGCRAHGMTITADGTLTVEVPRG